MDKSFYLLSTSFDDNNTEYVSTVEHKSLPIYGTQWHPEKNAFEWSIEEKHNSIPHDPKAVEIAQYMANFFVQKSK